MQANSKRKSNIYFTSRKIETDSISTRFTFYDKEGKGTKTAAIDILLKKKHISFIISSSDVMLYQA
ncbi:hypothetical protein A8L45_03105 [Veronia pacifica]|uniref:Uncharacterized protein n=1 Tax=Veronia pacifica TaxID=1080227 RepID=A0A1C3EQV0_9GAMM|nr:hypothetical protein A8L45_03105 [Veronia pacifica]